MALEFNYLIWKWLRWISDQVSVPYFLGQVLDIFGHWHLQEDVFEDTS